ncbi:MAG: AMP-binding protein [Acidobacteria bacterium]|nr:AMP-binding protein [Acidobacteriota bacterium]MBV9146736.1 AMP-binding protein [Acidobacteriota bacterium]MBV9434499.1 AMP-binding protein [Acidobacteriota bacterium]
MASSAQGPVSSANTHRHGDAAGEPIGPQRVLPNWFLRLVLWLLTHVFYRVRVIGRENLPTESGALLVCNHMSFVDAVMILAAARRPIRFLIFQDIYELPMVRPWMKMLRAIPISSEQRPRDLIRSLREATEAIRGGELVCIFAEGQITRTGQMLPFRRGMERIMKGVDAPIVPVNLHGLWGSIFSFEGGRFLWKRPRRIPYPVTVSFGQPLPGDSSPFVVRQAVQELGTEAFLRDRKSAASLDHTFVRTARRYRRHFFMADSRAAKLSFGAALTRSIFLARRLAPRWHHEEMVGVLIPPSGGGALVNFAALLLGRVPVNLNYTASSEVIDSCARQCGLKTVVTSRTFLERFPNLKIPGEAIILEDLAANPGVTEKIASLFISMLPFSLLKKALRASQRSVDDLATVIFSSGSTGDPKGVMLTHYNIASNVQQVMQVFRLDSDDKLLGILPFFHSFGFTIGLLLPALTGVGVVFHANPLDATTISELVSKYRVTVLIATPTFLQAYIRRCSPEHFGSLKYVLAGAEKLADRVANAFEDTFGLRPLEGYGTTECSPVIAVNGPGFRAPGFRQVAAKRGRVGHPLPGVSVRIVDPGTGTSLNADRPGLLHVKGPNVMKGYLSKPEKTAEVLRDGWYITGDIVSMEADGFLTITDRLTRFSKIGGEMVPHIRIEDKLQELAESTEQNFVVTAVEDEKKGERLLVLHTLSEDKLKEVLDKLSASELPALWKPRPNSFFRVEALPYLGTGKLDLRAVKQRAAELAEASAVGR